MANITFKEAYDADQARPGGPLADQVDSTQDDDFIGISIPDPDNNNELVDVGMTLSQLRRAIDQPAYIHSGNAVTVTPGTAITEIPTNTPIPSVIGFPEGSQFQIEVVAQKTQNASGSGHFGLRFGEGGETDTNSFVIWVPFASGDLILTRRTTINLTGVTADQYIFQFPPNELPDPYGLSTATPDFAIISVADTTVDPFTFEFVCQSDAADNTSWQINSFSVFGLKGCI